MRIHIKFMFVSLFRTAERLVAVGYTAYAFTLWSEGVEFPGPLVHFFYHACFVCMRADEMFEVGIWADAVGVGDIAAVDTCRIIWWNAGEGEDV
jgi:hypothetical protein